MQKIKELITDGKTKEAIQLLNEYITAHPDSDEAYYLLGNAYRKEENTRMELSQSHRIESGESGKRRVRHDDTHPRLLQQRHLQSLIRN